MPTLQSANFFLSLTYTSVQPAVQAIYKDTRNNQYYFLAVTGTGATANYAVIGSIASPVLGTLTKVSGTGDTTVTLTAVINQQVVTLGFTRVEAGQSVTTPEFFATLPFGIVQTSTSPSYNNTVYSALITSNGSYSITATLTVNYIITFFMNQTSTGSIAIQPNSIGTPTILIGGNSFTLTCADRLISTVAWVVTGSVITTILVEQI